MLEELFAVDKLALARNFFKVEVSSYLGRAEIKDNEIILTEMGIEHLKALEEIFVKEFKEKCPEGCDWITFNSSGNCGLLEQSLTVYAKTPFWNWEKNSISVCFCTCGKLKCWGSISIIEKR
jgi:hypothetical protein